MLKMKDTLHMPEEVKYILDSLDRNGFEAYIVGGCVRDGIMGRDPGDWDITTNALPAGIKSVFGKTLDTGIKHGTVTVLVNGVGFEVTTYRIDGMYEDNRRPANVEFTSSLESDLSRRDFTMNAIAYHPDKGFIDPFGGMGDIKARLIRTVGNAADRFREDALRMLRAVRFSSRLDFVLHIDTFHSICENCRLICNISQERIRDELTGILTSDHPMRFILLRDTGMLQFLLPEFEVCFHILQNNPYHIYNVGVHSLRAVEEVQNDRHLRWVMLLHDIGKPVARTVDENGTDHFYGHPEKSVHLAEIILKRLRFDGKSIERILKLVKYHDRDIQTSAKAVRKAVAVVGDDIFEDLLKVKEADKRAQNPEYQSFGLACISRIRELYQEIRAEGQCLGLKDLAVGGSDLLDLGFPQGRGIKNVLNKLLDMVIENPALNDKSVLLERALAILDGNSLMMDE